MISVNTGTSEAIKLNHVAQTHLLCEEGISPSYFCQWFKVVEVSLQCLVQAGAAGPHEQRGIPKCGDIRDR